MKQILLSHAARGAGGHHPAWHPAFASPAPPATPLLVPALVAAVNETANGITAMCPHPADGIFKPGTQDFYTSFPAHEAETSLVARQVFNNTVLSLAVVRATARQYTVEQAANSVS